MTMTCRLPVRRTVRRAVAPLIVACCMAAPLGPVVGLSPIGAASAPQSGQADASPVVDPLMYAALRYRMVGPHRGGRVTAIAGIRQQPCTFYMGSTGGGVWKTSDCGILWEPVSDGQMTTGSIGSIAVAESDPNVVYVGTGSAAIRSNVIIGRGAYKSIDAGKTWRFIGLREAGQIGSVAIHPSNPDIVWMAALGSPYGPNDDRGVFKTQDGGRTWRRVLFVNRETGARVVAVNPSNPSEVYAGMYRAFRKGWDIISGGPATEGGIYKSTDGGDTWIKLAAGLPKTLIGKIDLDIARSKPATVYAMIEAPEKEGGLYKSVDAGLTWKLVNNEQRLRARPFYFHYVDVNPRNENEVWVNELGLWKSTDGGVSFGRVNTPHGDNHGIWFNPDNPNLAIQCNDGGATITQDGGRSWSSILNQPTAEFYQVNVDTQFPYRLYAPQQDNSTVIVPSLPMVAWGLDSPMQVWGQASGCETGQIMPRPDGKVIWGACKGEVGRYSTETGQEQHFWVYPQNRYGTNPREIKYRFPRQTVVYVSPHDPKIVYQASHVLHRTVDEGQTWEVISPDLTANEPDKQVTPGSPITRDITGEEVYSSIYAMTESRLEPGVLWAGANDGPVHVTRDAGKTWKNVTPAGLPPGGRVQTIEDSPHRKGSAFIAVYRYLREHDLQPYIYGTNDYGSTWTRLTDGRNGLPIDHPTRVVREDPGREGLLYAGTEFGIFVSFDAGRHWQSLQQNLPATPVTDIRVHRNDLVISTMGRSLWIMDNITPLQQVAERREGIVAAGAYVFPPRAAYRMRYAASGGSPDLPEYPAPGAQIDYYFRGEPEGEVRIDILDSASRPLRSFTSNPPPAGTSARSGRRGDGLSTVVPKHAGLNRFTWDMRIEGPAPSGEGSRQQAGPLAPPGTYQVRLTAGEDWSQMRSFDLRVDPRVAAAGVTQADLDEAYALGVKLRDAIGEAQQLASRIDEARIKAKADPARTKRLQALLARIVTAQIVYPQPMLIDQLANVARMLSQADQKPGRDAYVRFDDLMKELAAIKAEFAKTGGTR